MEGLIEGSLCLLVMVVVVLVLLLVWWASTYARLAGLRGQVRVAVGALVAQYRQRRDLIPSTEKAVRQAIKAQMDALQHILNARKELNQSPLLPDSGSEVAGELGALMSLVRTSPGRQPGNE